jgi:hypothetical protein
MKKLILLALTTLMMVGCEFSVEKDTKECIKSYHIIILDSCEYYSNTMSYDLTHKGNCRFCKERDSIKWEKRKKELEELVIKLKEK